MKQRTPEEMKAIIDAYVKKKKEVGEEQDKSLLERIIYGGTGAGILRGNLTPVIAGIKGNADMWHGSPAHNLMPNELGGGILNEGLDLRHAGKNQRLNSLLMSNSAQSMLEEYLGKQGRKLTPEDEEYLFNMIKKINQDAGHTAESAAMRAMSGAVEGKGMPASEIMSDAIRSAETAHMQEGGKFSKFKSLADRVMDRVPELSKRFNVPEEELRQHFNKNIGRLGKRVYFGTSPESVSFWSGHGNEAGFAGGKLMGDMQRSHGAHPSDLESLKLQGKIIGSSVANQLTGGYFNTVKEKLKYGRPDSVHTLSDLDALKAHLRVMGDDLGKHNVMMQYSIPTGTLDSMADFPIARRIIQSSPALKDLMGNFMPQADPSKDMSITENVSPKKIKTVDLVDKATGKLKQRIHISNHEKTPFNFLGGKGNRLNTLKNIAAPAALSLVGANLLHKAIAPNKKTKVKNIADDIPDLETSKDKKKGLAKKAASDPKMLAALLGVPVAAGLGIAGGTYLSDKALNRKNYQMLPEELEKKFTSKEKEDYNNRAINEYTKGMIGANAATVAGTALGTFADMSPLSYKAGLGGYLGSQLLTPVLSSQIAQAEKAPETVVPFADKIPAVEKFVKEHPYITGGVAGGLTAGALPASVYHIAKKYYPYHTKEFMDMIKGSIKDKGGISGMMEDLQDAMPHLKGEKGKSAWNHLKQSVKHLPHNLFIPGMGLAAAGATALILNAGMRAKHKVERHIEENKENK
jgi:hypothetical protein